MSCCGDGGGHGRGRRGLGFSGERRCSFASPRGSSAFAICRPLRHGIARIRRFSRSRPRARARTRPTHALRVLVAAATASAAAAASACTCPFRGPPGSGYIRPLRPRCRQQSTFDNRTQRVHVAAVAEYQRFSPLSLARFHVIVF